MHNNILNTNAPFVAGVGSMTYRKYIVTCIAGAILWVVSITLLGYFFGNIPIVKENFEFVVLGIIVLSLVPVGVEYLKYKKKQTK